MDTDNGLRGIRILPNLYELQIETDTLRRRILNSNAQGMTPDKAAAFAEIRAGIRPDSCRNTWYADLLGTVFTSTNDKEVAELSMELLQEGMRGGQYQSYYLLEVVQNAQGEPYTGKDVSQEKQLANYKLRLARKSLIAGLQDEEIYDLCLGYLINNEQVVKGADTDFNRWFINEVSNQEFENIRHHLFTDNTSRALTNTASAVGYLLASDNPEIEGKYIGLIEKWIDSQGLDGKQVFSAWKKSHSYAWNNKTEDRNTYTRRDGFRNTLIKNIQALQSLTIHNKEAARALHIEFGITDFGRYSINTLIAQFDEKDDITCRYVTCILPEADHNGTFYKNADLFDKLYHQLHRHGYSLRYVEAKNLVRLYGTFKKMNAKYNVSGTNLIQGLVIGGHSDSLAIWLGEEGDSDVPDYLHYLHTTAFLDGEDDEIPANFKIRRIREKIKEVKKFLSHKAPIVAVACSSGRANGIVQHMSKTLETYATGEQNNVNISDIDVLVDNGQLIFVVTYEDGSQKTYLNGREISV